MHQLPPLPASIEKKNTVFQFGEVAEGYVVPVLNEREIRAAAGLMFLGLFMAFILIQFKQDFVPVKYVMIIFLTDFFLRVCISPRFSPLLIIGRFITRAQAPEYVAAAPKKFAWTIGLVLSSLMTALLVVLNSYSIITTLSCFACLVFLFFESAFGICIGCVMYSWFFKKPALYCAGASCEERKKEAIQQVTKVQLLSLLGFAVFLFLVVLFLNDSLQASPHRLQEMLFSN